MRRDSKAVLRLCWALQERNARVEPRSIERWSQAGLGPFAHVSIAVQLNHYALLSEICGTGFTNDLVARRLAARGFPCLRLRDSIMAATGVPAEPSVIQVPDLATGPSGDAGFEEVERIASAVVDDIPTMPRTMSYVIRALLRNAGSNPEKLVGHWDSGEEVFHSFLVNGMCAVLGDGMYLADPLVAVFNLDPDEIRLEDVEEINRTIQWSIGELEESYRSASLDDIVAMAVFLREAIPQVLQHLEIDSVAPLDVDNAAALLAPGMVYLAKKLATTHDDFPPEILPSLTDV